MQQLDGARTFRDFIPHAPHGGYTTTADLALQAVAVGNHGPFSRHHVVHHELGRGPLIIADMGRSLTRLT
jgi:hypothetical protein